MELNNILSLLSKADSLHDFKTDIPGLSFIIEETDIYNLGLPGGISSSVDEKKALSSVIKSINDETGERDIDNFDEYLVASKEDGIINGTNPYIIKTRNGNEYSVKSCIVESIVEETETESRSKTHISAYDFITKLNIEDHSAIIVDATAVSILEILKKNPTDVTEKEDINNKTIYFVTTPEVCNDPAGKTSPDETFFNNISENDNGIKFISCEPNDPPTLNYNYRYELGSDLTDKNISSYDKFFTSYNFQLSELQRNRKGKRTEYTTNLLITNSDGESEEVLDSKKKNSIKFLEPFLNEIIRLFKTNTKIDNLSNFLFNAKIQQKRSGDWLQVLVCLLLKSRNFKIYRPPGEPPKPGDENVQENFTNIYFVTHDRIALAFALLCGVECIYTHTRTRSAYIFKQSSLEMVISNLSTRFENQQKKLEEINKIIKNPEPTELIYIYRNDLTVKFNFYEEIQDTFINHYPKTIMDVNINLRENDPSFVKNFTNFTTDIFSKCLMYCHLLINYPDLTPHKRNIDHYIKEIEQTIDIQIKNNTENNEIIKKLSEDGLISQLKEIINNNDKIINLYNKIINNITFLYSIFSKYFTDKTDVLKIDIQGTINKYRKTPNYKLASGWDWNNTQGNSRIWETFKNIVGSSNPYKSDKNVFLYDLDLLNSDIKKYLNTKYKEIFEFINKIENDETYNYFNENNNNPMSDYRKKKFLMTSKGFCGEVFLNFPINQIEEIPTEEEEHIITHIICLENERFVPDDNNPNALNPITKIEITEIENLLSDNVIISEHLSENNDKNKICSSLIERNIVADNGLTLVYDEFDNLIDIVGGGKKRDKKYNLNDYETRAMTLRSNRRPPLPLMGSKVFYSNVETNIKNTTYLLLTSNLDYKSNEYVLREFIREIENENNDIIEEEVKGGMQKETLQEKNTEKIKMLTELAEKLDINPSTEKEKKIDLLKTNQYFHPMLPIFMIAESLNQIVNNDNIDESLDYELYLNYFTYLKTLRDTVHEIYKSKENIDIAISIIIGAGLKELLFDSDVYNITLENTSHQDGGTRTSSSTIVIPSSDSVESVTKKIQNKEGIPLEQQRLIFHKQEEPVTTESVIEEPVNFIESNLYCEKIMGISKEKYLPISILTGVFKNYISGYKKKTSQDIEKGKHILLCKIFSNYIKSIKISNIFSLDTDGKESLSSFKEKTFQFLFETGNIIIKDRGGTPIEINTKPQPPLREVMAEAAELRFQKQKETGGTKKKLIKKYKCRTIKKKCKTKKNVSKCGKKIKTKIKKSKKTKKIKN